MSRARQFKMRIVLPLAAFCLLLPGFACAPLRMSPRTEPRPDRQILVTFKSTASMPLRAAGSSTGSYVESSDYTVSKRTRRTVVRLARDYDLRELDGWPIRALGVHCVVFELPGGRSTAELIDRLERDPRIDSAQPMNTFEVLGQDYDDPYAEMQHGLEATGVWEVHAWTRGRGVEVAVVDTGVHTEHPDLVGSIAATRDFVGQDATVL